MALTDPSFVFAAALRGAWHDVQAAVVEGFAVNTRHRGMPLLLCLTDRGGPWAAQHVHLPTLRLVLAHGADPNLVCDPWPSAASSGCWTGRSTALHSAVSTRDVGAVAALLDAGADVNAQSAPGLCPLMLAVRGARLQGAADCLRLLLAAPDLDVGVLLNGRSAGEWARHERRSELADMIDAEVGVSHGALVTIVAPDKDGRLRGDGVHVSANVSGWLPPSPPSRPLFPGCCPGALVTHSCGLGERGC